MNVKLLNNKLTELNSVWKENIKEHVIFKIGFKTFPTVQWLRLCASIARGMGSIPDQGTKIPQATKSGPKIRKDFKYDSISENLSFWFPSLIK